MSNNQVTLIIVAITLWDLAWKGAALWKAARSSQRNWFVLLLIANTLGILPIVYIKFFQAKPVKKARSKRS